MEIIKVTNAHNGDKMIIDVEHIKEVQVSSIELTPDGKAKKCSNIKIDGGQYGTDTNYQVAESVDTIYEKLSVFI